MKFESSLNKINLSYLVNHRREGEISQNRISEINETIEADPCNEEAISQKLKTNSQ